MGNEGQKRRKTPGKLLSQRALAAALGITQPAVFKMIRRPSWPFGLSPWHPSLLPAIRIWHSKRRAQRAGDLEGAELADAKFIVGRMIGRDYDTACAELVRELGL